MDKRDKAQTILRHHLRIVVFNDDYLNFLTQVCLTRMRRAAFDMAEIGLALAGQTLVVP